MLKVEHFGIAVSGFCSVYCFFCNPTNCIKSFKE